LPRPSAKREAIWIINADRLDLGRVGIAPDPELLCTGVARDLLLAKRAWFAHSRRHAPWADSRSGPG
jgi:hypothetical protein